MFIKILLALTIVFAAAPVHAQGPLPTWPEPADEFVREAIGSSHARALLKTFAASVRKNGDPSCLQAKTLDESGSIARGRALLQRYGLQMMKIQQENFDRVAYQSALSASAGPGAVAEIQRLKRDPEVKALVVLYRPIQIVKGVAPDRPLSRSPECSRSRHAKGVQYGGRIETGADCVFRGSPTGSRRTVCRPALAGKAFASRVPGGGGMAAKSLYKRVNYGWGTRIRT